MSVITEDYVCFETAKLLAKKSFDYSAEYESYYTLDGTIVYFKDNPQEVNIAPRITLQMAMKWLRELHGLFIRITENMAGNIFEWSVYQKHYGCKASTYVEDSYEEAVETAIKYCLENLI